MSSRIIRSRDQVKKPIIIGPGDDHPSGLPRDHVMNIEKQAFEQGYREGERMGKEMGAWGKRWAHGGRDAHMGKGVRALRKR